MPISYLVNRLWVFRSRDDVLQQSIRFAVAYLSSLVIGNLIFWLLYEFLGLGPLVAQGTAILILVSAYFLLQAGWTFAERNPARTGEPAAALTS